MPDLATVVLEKPVAGGRSLARLDGRVVLVSGGIPGERVRIVVERSGKGVAFGRVVEVEEASPDRVEPGSDPQCGGLVFAHVSYARQLALKRDIVADAFTRIGRLHDVPEIGVVGSPTHGWRLRARLHVQGGRVGFFREGSHVLCDAAATGQLVPGLLDLAQHVLAELRGDVARSVEALLVTTTVDGEQATVHLELARPLARRGEPWASGGAPALPAHCAGVSAALSASRQASVLWGQPWLREPLRTLGAGAEARGELVRHAAAFFQGNRALVPALVARVLASVDVGCPLVDLYAGVGLFGIAAASAAGVEVTCVEGDAISAEDLVTNAAPFAGRVRAVRGAVEDVIAQEAARLGNACIIVDPPRTGLAPVVSSALATARPSRVVYVSCDPATLARDLQVLTAGGLRIADVTMFDMFPQTAHVETLVTLHRADA